MAKRNYGGGVTGDSGSFNKRVGGEVYQKNGRVRVRVVPIQPNTAKQSFMRALTTAISKHWVNLTEAERVQFNEAAKDGTWTRKDEFRGINVNFTSGFELYQYLSLNASVATQAEVYVTSAQHSAPGTSAFDEWTAEAETGDFVTLTVGYTGALGTNEAHLVYMSKVRPAGQMAYRKNGLRLVSVSTGATPIDLEAGYTEYFGNKAAAAGEKFDYLIVAVDKVTGNRRFLAQGTQIVVAG